MSKSVKVISNSLDPPLNRKDTKLSIFSRVFNVPSGSEIRTNDPILGPSVHPFGKFEPWGLLRQDRVFFFIPTQEKTDPYVPLFFQVLVVPGVVSLRLLSPP